MKTLAYVVIALALSAGLLMLAWRVSESVLRVEQPEPAVQSVPQQQPQPAEPDATVKQGSPEGETPKPAPAADAGKEEPAKATLGDDGYYDDGVSSPSVTVPAQDGADPVPYQPQVDGQAKEDTARQFPGDDREVDRPKPPEEGARDAGPDDPNAPDPYAPDPRDVN